MSKRIIKFSKNTDHSCLICGKHTDTVDMSINRDRGDNIITFAICHRCLERIVADAGAKCIALTEPYREG